MLAFLPLNYAGWISIHVRKSLDIVIPSYVMTPNLCPIKPIVDPGGLVVIIFASGSEVRWFDPDRGQWIFSELKNPECAFLRKGSRALGPVS